MSRNPYAARRPGGVTFVVFLTLLVGFVSMVRGFLALFGVESAITPTDLAGTSGAVYGWGELILGVITIAVGLGLAGGSNLARFLVTALMVLRIIAAIWTALTFAGQGGILVSALVGGFAVIILLLLWNSRADRFFAEN
jgi:vacuolar-type H+-ATPase subunit I/STV1